MRTLWHFGKRHLFALGVGFDTVWLDARRGVTEVDKETTGDPVQTTAQVTADAYDDAGWCWRADARRGEHANTTQSASKEQGGAQEQGRAQAAYQNGRAQGADHSDDEVQGATVAEHSDEAQNATAAEHIKTQGATQGATQSSTRSETQGAVRPKILLRRSC